MKGRVLVVDDDAALAMGTACSHEHGDALGRSRVLLARMDGVPAPVGGHEYADRDWNGLRVSVLARGDYRARGIRECARRPDGGRRRLLDWRRPQQPCRQWVGIGQQRLIGNLHVVGLR